MTSHSFRIIYKELLLLIIKFIF